MTAEEKTKAVLKDWFVRDGKTYVYKNTKHKLDWEKTTTDSYSDFVGKFKEDDKFIKSLYEHCKSYMKAMLLPNKITLKFNNEEGFYTYGRGLVVSTKVLDSKKHTANQKADIVFGLTVHEGAHILHTDFKACQELGNQKAIFGIYNVLEDERIERLIGEKLPGFANYLAAAKKYFFDVAPKPTSYLGDLLTTFFRIIRYPKDIPFEWFEKFKGELEKIKTIITPYPTSTKKCVEAAKKIGAIIHALAVEEDLKKRKIKKPKDPAEKKPEKSKKPNDEKSERKSKEKSDEAKTDDTEDGDYDTGTSGEQESEDGGYNAEEDGESEQDGEGGTPYTADDWNPDGDDNDVSGEKSKDDTGTPSKKPAKGGGDTDEAISKPLTPEEYEEALKEYRKDLKAATERVDIDDHRLKEMVMILTAGKGSDGTVETSSKITLLKELILEGVAVESTNKTYLIEKPITVDSQKTYNEDYSVVKKYIPAVASKLVAMARDYAYKHKSMRFGSLDTAKIVEASMGVETVYETKGKVKTSGICVCVLVDESGSMSGSIPDSLDLTKIIQARRTAILIEAALVNVPNVTYFAYGHTADTAEFSDLYMGGDTTIHVYHEPGYTNKVALGNIESKSQNRDGVAILECAKRVRTFTDLPCVMFIISDGAPCAVGYSNGVQHVRQCVTAISKDNFFPIHIAIDTHVASNKMFDKFVVLDNLDNLARDLGRQVQQAVLKMTVTNIE